MLIGRKETIQSLQRRNDEHFVSLTVKNLLNSVDDEQERRKFHEDVTQFYETSISYIMKCSQHLADFSPLSCMTLENDPQWTSVEESLTWFNTKGVKVDDSFLFEQIGLLSKYVEKELAKESSKLSWKEKLAHERWYLILSNCCSVEQYSQALQLVQFYFSIASHNANVERVFSLMNS